MKEQNRKIAIVTGVGNERGIGAATCRKLACNGVDIFFTYWMSKDGWAEQFKSEIIELGVCCEYMEIDLSKADAAERIMNEVTRKMDNPSILVNNAAHSIDVDYLQMNAKILDDHYAVNVRSTCLLCAEFAKRFNKVNHAYGRIINITSGQDLGPMPGNLAYVASKGAISAFTVSLSAELAHLGITVNAVNPGPTDSNWMNEEIRENLRPKFLMGRVGEPEDAARVIFFLASDEANWITGQVIHSEGGFLRV
ncbi:MULTISPECIES: SDR family oxidoreductase [Bacillus]|uniref:SDR family oxidoreductase n=1 Tax=Bacillus TaxID=1386 RepID=UPI0002F15248|nr:MULTISPECIES: SDR family oxidoreductase [Bacillus]